MPEPLTDDALAAIRTRAELVNELHDNVAEYFNRLCASARDISVLLVEVERLRANIKTLEADDAWCGDILSKVWRSTRRVPWANGCS